jgi:predicted lipoprotein with Yx(FWY)xxD motif
MNRIPIPLVAVAVLVAGVVAVVVSTSGASTSKAQQRAAAGSTISLGQTSLGKTLVDGNGRTLYLFDADKPNVSTLSAAGQAVWPPFTDKTKPRARGGVLAGRIGTIASASGSAQVTYNGHPLYYYVGDSSPGQVKGQALNQFGALWYVLAPSGSAVTSASSAPAATSSGGTGGYGY